MHGNPTANEDYLVLKHFNSPSTADSTSVEGDGLTQEEVSMRDMTKDKVHYQ